MSNAEQPFYRRPLWIVVAIFLAVALVGGGIAIATSVLGGGDDSRAAGPTSAASSTRSAVPASAESVCGLNGYETSGTLTSAPSADWTLIGSTAAPQSDTAGPGKNEDGGVFNTCFAHTPTGALFASVNYLATTTDSRNTDRVWELLADGEAKNLLKTSPPADDQGASSRGQVSGFKVNSYDASSATIDLAVTISGTGGADQLISYPVVLKWEGGDWKVVFTKDGPPISPSALSSLGGYIPFAGV
jgi:hypothetical protein